MNERRNYRLVAVDMDGTLLNSKHEITEHTLEIIHKAVENGKEVAVATGRALSELSKVRRFLPDVRYAICANGANLYDLKENRTLRNFPMDPATVKVLFERLKPYDLLVQVFCNGQSMLEIEKEADLRPYAMENFRGEFELGSVYVPDFREAYAKEPKVITKLIFYFRSAEDRWSYCKSIADQDILATNSLGYGVELTDPKADKGQGLRALCEVLGIDPEDSMAIGDGGNDADLLMGAGMKIAMGNAIDRVKSVAEYITDDNDHEGVANAIEKFML